MDTDDDTKCKYVDNIAKSVRKATEENNKDQVVEKNSPTVIMENHNLFPTLQSWSELMNHYNFVHDYPKISKYNNEDYVNMELYVLSFIEPPEWKCKTVNDLIDWKARELKKCSNYYTENIPKLKARFLEILTASKADEELKKKKLHHKSLIENIFKIYSTNANSDGSLQLIQKKNEKVKNPHETAPKKRKYTKRKNENYEDEE